MKTYILRAPKTVEPQTSPRPLRPDPALTATVDMICGRPVPPPPLLAGRVLFIGLDVHNDSIAVSLAPSDSTEVRRYGIIGGEHDDVHVQPDEQHAPRQRRRRGNGRPADDIHQGGEARLGARRRQVGS